MRADTTATDNGGTANGRGNRRWADRCLPARFAGQVGAQIRRPTASVPHSPLVLSKPIGQESI